MYRAAAVSKSYGKVHALRGVDLAVEREEVHALLGANGAGKSTLVKALVGAQRPTTGTLEFDGRVVDFRSVRDAARQGVAYVSQELSLFPDLDVASNLFMLREPTVLGVVSRRAMEARAAPVLGEVGLDIPLHRRVGELRLGEQHLVEIARALLLAPKVIVLDEPTSALQADESERLLGVIRRLRASGSAILYVSHFLEEVFAIADKITILRDGRAVATALRPADTSIGEVSALITGDASAEPAAVRPRWSQAQSESLRPLKVSGLSRRRRLARLDLEVWPGEIVGLAGLDGAGHETVMAVLSGAIAATEGHVYLPDERMLGSGTVRAVRQGVAYVSGDRRQGLLTTKTVWENIGMVAGLARGRGGAIWSSRRYRARANRWIERLGIVSAVPELPVSALSGGNQQKVLLAMWLSTQPQLLLLDDPTRGVDVGATAEIHTVIREAAADGAVVMLSSTDMDELAGICDRVLVFYRGAAKLELEGVDLNPHAILEAINTPVLATAAMAGGTARTHPRSKLPEGAVVEPRCADG